jgi:hypothetical protein
MATSPFVPEPGITTHSAFTERYNQNLLDLETRISNLEGINLNQQYSQQSLSSSAGVIVLDVFNGYNAIATLTEDSLLTITNASAGDGGIILVKQDATGGWELTSPGYNVLVGFLEETPTVSINEEGVISVTWYYDGSDYYLFVSDAT